MKHISEDDLERLYLGMIPEGPELNALEDHLLACLECSQRAEESNAYVDAMRAAIIQGNFDIEWEEKSYATETFHLHQKTNRDRR